MASQKQSKDPRRNLRKQQQSQHDAIEKKHHLVDEESEDGIDEEQTHEDATMVNVGVENRLEATDDESNGIPSDVGELDEWTCLDLQLLHKDFMCPICLGVMDNTKTFNHCLHRFCRGCANKAMNNKKECPTCRKFYGTNRVLRKDQTMESIIEVVIGDISQYEIEDFNSTLEQEHQQQAISVTGPVDDIGSTSIGTSAKRSSNGQENDHARKRTHKPRTRKRYANQSDEIEHDLVIQNEDQQDQVKENETNRNEDDENKEDNEIMAEIIQLKSKKLKRFSQDSCIETSGGVVSNTEISSCGGAATSNHGSWSGAMRIRNTRLTRLAKHLRVHGQKKKKNDQFEIHVSIISLNTNKVGNLENSNFFCSPAMSFQHLREGSRLMGLFREERDDVPRERERASF